MTILFESAIRVTLIAAIIGLLLLLMRIKTASARHAVWAGVVVTMMLLPAWVAWGPKASIPVLPPERGLAIELLPPPSPAGLVSTTPARPVSNPAPSPARQGGGYTAIYLLGVGVFLLRLAIGTIRANRLTSASCVVPVTVGLLHPKIILPESSREWPQAQLDAVLAHEGEHICRRDPLFQWLALLNRALFWFHPLAWWLERKLSGLAEEACDASVLARGYDPREYSEYLLDLARSVERAGARIEAVGMAMPGIGLRHRIRRILSGVPVPRISRPRMACTLAVCVGAAAILTAGTLGRAQSPAPQFEVASIKANKSGAIRTSMMPYPEGRLTVENNSVRQLIRSAFEVKDFQITGGPKWLDVDRYDLVAKAEGPASREQLMRMLQSLLADRFKLTFHTVTKQLPVLSLVVAKKGQLGPSISLRKVGTGEPRLFPILGPPGRMNGSEATMQQLAASLSGTTGDRLVLDRTGLTGTYDFTLAWTPERPLLPSGVPPEVLERIPNRPPADGPSLSTALQEQLGLRLESGRGPVEIMVIDHVEKPSEN